MASRSSSTESTDSLVSNTSSRMNMMRSDSYTHVFPSQPRSKQTPPPRPEYTAPSHQGLSSETKLLAKRLFGAESPPPKENASDPDWLRKAITECHRTPSHSPKLVADHTGQGVDKHERLGRRHLKHLDSRVAQENADKRINVNAWLTEQGEHPSDMPL